MAEDLNKAELIEPTSEVENLDPIPLPKAEAFARIQLQVLLAHLLMRAPDLKGSKPLTGTELRVFLHLVSRAQWGNKVVESQIWLAEDLGITPSAYCRGLARLEEWDLVRKRPFKSNPRMIDYLLLNPLLVRYFHSASQAMIEASYRSLPRDRVKTSMRPSSTSKRMLKKQSIEIIKNDENSSTDSSHDAGLFGPKFHWVTGRRNIELPNRPNPIFRK